MIISASRRTDIPAYFSEWFVNRIKEKFCLVPNPFNTNQVSFVDLSPETVDVIVFWTRNPKPLIKHLDFLERNQYKYYFQFTVNNYPKIYEKFNPTLENVSQSFINISNKIGKGKIIWRYDPIIFTDDLTPVFHLKNFEYIAENIGEYTKRVVISIVDDYVKTNRRLNKLETNYQNDQINKPFLEEFLFKLVNIAKRYDLEVQSCAESIDLEQIGIIHGKCIDDHLIKREFGIDLTFKKDKSQRIACGCTISKDIGINDTCLMGCEYCYATNTHNISVKNKVKHNSQFPAILTFDISEKTNEIIEKFKNKELNPNAQLSMDFNNSI